MLVAFDESVTYNVTLQKGMKNILFNKDGAILVTLTGRGSVYLQVKFQHTSFWSTENKNGDVLKVVNTLDCHQSLLGTSDINKYIID